MKLNAKQKLKKNWEKLQESTEKMKNNFTGKLKKRADRTMGKWVHKQVATLFIWDEHIQGWVFGGKKCKKCNKYNRDKFDECQNCGESLEDAEDFKGINGFADEDLKKSIMESEKMKAYVMYKCNQDRKYQKKMDEVGGKLKEKKDLLKNKFDKMKGKKFLKWLGD